MKYSEFEEFSETIYKIANMQLPIKISRAMQKLYNEVEEESKIYQDVKTRVIQGYAKKDDDGEVINDNGIITFSAENIEHYKDFINTEIEILNKLPKDFIDILESFNVPLSLKDLNNLEKVIDI